MNRIQITITELHTKNWEVSVNELYSNKLKHNLGMKRFPTLVEINEWLSEFCKVNNIS